MSNKLLRLWADMVSGPKIDMIAAQRPPPLGEFIARAGVLQGAIDPMGLAQYALPG